MRKEQKRPIPIGAINVYVHGAIRKLDLLADDIKVAQMELERVHTWLEDYEEDWWKEQDG